MTIGLGIALIVVGSFLVGVCATLAVLVKTGHL